MEKFGRNYKIVFEIGERGSGDLTDYNIQEVIEVKYPFTLHFKVSSGINFGNVSSGSFQLYNLAPVVRAKLWKDNFNQKKFVTMYLYAGYGDNLPLIFKGDILECYSYRNGGDVDYITDIKSDDGSYLFQYGISNATFDKGTKTENLLQSLLMETPQYKLGYITANIPPLRRNKTFIGQTLDLLGSEYGGYQIFIDKGELNILDTNDVVPSDLLVITAESGLLGSPCRAEQFLKVTTLFEPRLKLGQAIELISESLPFVNNIYKVVGFTHSGVISPVKCGKAITEIQLYLGLNPFNELKRATIADDTLTSTGVWQKPVNGGRITSNFGYRNAPTAGASTGHKGIDIGIALNSPVYATENGTVTGSYINGGFGQFISINHGKDAQGNNLSSWYGHLNKRLVFSGQKVTKGQQIGLVGSTGISTGPHLHFQVMKNGTPINPIQYIGAWG